MHYFLTQRELISTWDFYRINLFYNVMGYKVNKVLWKHRKNNLVSESIKSLWKKKGNIWAKLRDNQISQISPAG